MVNSLVLLLVLATCRSTTAVCPYVTNRWLLNSSASGSTIVDSVGSWNGVAYGGFAFVPDSTPTSNGAISLDGSSGYVQLGPNTFGGAMSWAFWAKFGGPTCTSSHCSWMRFFDWGTQCSNNIFMTAISTDPGPMAIGIINAAGGCGTSYFNYPNYAVQASVWTHFIITVDSSANGALYVNGSQVYSAPLNAVPNYALRSTNYFGRSTYAQDPYLKAYLADFQFALGHAFSQVEAMYMFLFNNCYPPPPPPPTPPPLPLPLASPPPPPPPSPAPAMKTSRSSLGIILGVAVGGAGGMFSIVLGVFYFCFRDSLRSVLRHCLKEDVIITMLPDSLGELTRRQKVLEDRLGGPSQHQEFVGGAVVGEPASSYVVQPPAPPQANE